MVFYKIFPLKDSRYIFFIILLSGILYVPFLGHVHLFDWDEINFAESAREMLVSGNYLDVQINFEKFWEKPPLFIWLQVLSMKIFGINEFAARFPNAIVGVFSLISLFFIGKNIKNTKFGIIWVSLYASSILPFLYFKSGIIDPLFNLFIFLGIYFFYLFSKDQKNSLLRIFLSASFIGLGILTKGPVALLLFGLTAFVYMIIKKQYKKYISFKLLLPYVLIVSLAGGFWFILQYLNGNKQILVDFIEYQIRLFSTKDAGHGGFFLYHFVVILFGVFPASIFALKGFKSLKDKTELKDFNLWMQILFWVVLILFSIVSTKIAHYSSLAYFPVTFLASYYIYYWLDDKKPISNWLNALLVFIASIWALVVIAIPIVGKNTQKIIKSHLIYDSFTNANLEADIYWTGFESLIGVVFIIVIIWGVYFTKNKKKKLIGILVASVFFTYSTLLFIVPKIEEYSQGALIEFYQKHAKETAYFSTYGIKSYAQYFYANIPNQTNNSHHNLEWYRTGKTDKTVYIITRNKKATDFIKKYPNFAKLYEKNGFVFFQKIDLHDKK